MICYDTYMIQQNVSAIALQAEELAELMALSPIEFYLIDPETAGYLYANEAATRNTGYSLDELSRMHVYDLVPDITVERIEAIAHAANSKTAVYNIARHRRKDGSTYLVRAQIYVMAFRGRDVFVAFDTDITEQHRLERLAAERAEILDKATNEIYIVDYKTHRYLYVNQGACNNLGYSREELLEMTIFDINPDLTYEQTVLLKKAGEGRSHLTNRTRHRRKDGTTYPVHALIQHIAYREYDAYLLVDTDITELEEARKALQYQAFYDQLTGLPNRQLFRDRLQQALARAQRHSQIMAILFIDYDHFKQVNDTYGHDVGDKVLQQIARRLRTHVRASDTVARLGGDEFLILLEDIRTKSEVVELLSRIIEVETMPVQIDTHTFHLSCSVGCAFFPDDGTDAETLIRHADMAMYQAKQNGRSRFHCYSQSLGRDAEMRMQMLSCLRDAQNHEEFLVYYQPQICLKSGRCTGFEALLRWRRSDGTIVAAGEFIPYASHGGLLGVLGDTALNIVFAQMRVWSDAGVDFGRIALNLSMQELSDPQLPERLEKGMRRFAIRPELLEFEITESEMMRRPAEMMAVLRRINDLGIALAVDDFGSGYSLLSYLKRFPVQRLKIDREFIKSLPGDRDDASIIRMIVALADAMQLETVATGVETRAQSDFLAANGCDNAQGYYFAHPMPAESVTDYLAEFSKNQ